MVRRKDVLGRRITPTDYAARSKKSERTKKEKYGSDFHKRAGSLGGRARKRGYFGRLKDEGKVGELQELAKAAGTKSQSRTLAEKREAALKTWETRRKRYGKAGRAAKTRSSNDANVGGA